MRLAVLDLVGTTVADGGLVLDAVRRGLVTVGVPVVGPRFPALERQARATTDRPVLRVFLDLLDGDLRRARLAADAYEAHLREAAEQGRVAEVPGAGAAIGALREAGTAVVLVAGVGPQTRDALVARAGLSADLLLTPADVGGRGWPEPDLVLAAATAVDTAPVDCVVVADSTAGMTAAMRSGAGLALGVPSGAHTPARLRAAGAHDVLDSVVDLPARLGLPQPPARAAPDAGHPRIPDNGLITPAG
ncbi:HAD family hydrolase [Pseudonocardia sp. RS010]|uniref:HAD family hydrolase n=1 Tax=Pseudonocardia sp. RS010 TaxID=3385979 RepID=UPI0039A2358E